MNASPQTSNRSLLESALTQPFPAIAYQAGRALRERWPGHAILQCAACGFDLDGFVEAGGARAEPVGDEGHNEVLTMWRGCVENEIEQSCPTGEEGILRRSVNAWLRVEWNGHTLKALGLSWREMVRTHRVWFLVGPELAVLEEFFAAVCRWTGVPHGEVLVFEKGTWRKDRDLYEAIREAREEDLVLAPGLRERVFEDLRQFFGRRDLYARLGVPWKRGILFLGPPGNGKTHAMKALCRALGLPVLYVRSLESAGMFQTGEQGHVAEVFELARRTAPCLLILEDLDSLITAANRSVLLNELDGFAQNTGLCVLATTNYPERLDPAILDRPSRFDRKYTFDLPGPAERRAFLHRWTHRQSDALRLSPEGVEALVNETDGFSFAYLKELCLASAMARVNAGPEESMDALARAQAQLLQVQRQTRPPEPPPARPRPRAPISSGTFWEEPDRAGAPGIRGSGGFDRRTGPRGTRGGTLAPGAAPGPSWHGPIHRRKPKRTRPGRSRSMRTGPARVRRNRPRV